MRRPIEIFFCYAHEDESLMDCVRRQLVIFDRQGIILKWHDRKIPPGSDWRGQIDARLRGSDIILLFVSPHFFDSDYIFEVEMQEAMQRHEAGNAIVIPIILEPSLWETAPFARLQALPRDGKPIATSQNVNEACREVAQGIMKVVFQRAG